MADTHTAPVVASRFHIGSTCPHCQAPLAEGQSIVSCERCASFHHEGCWCARGACASYHCDRRTRAAGHERPDVADVVLHADEVARVQLPAPAPPIGRRMAPRAPEDRPPRRRSLLAVLSFLLAAASLGALHPAAATEAMAVGLGALAATAAIVVAVIALLSINLGRNTRGGLPASLAILLAATTLMVYAFRLDMLMSGGSENVDLQLLQGGPSQAELDQMPVGTARAMRANVVVRSGGKGVLARIAEGSGIITKLKDGRAIILTNAHVVGDDANPDDLEVLMYNGEHSRAHLDWRAPEGIDLVFLSCEALTIGDLGLLDIAETLLAQGERTFAIGNPMSLHWSYTEGVISGIRRQRRGPRTVVAYQTQTPINHGNSGGGLYDMAGRLVGVNTWTQDKRASEGLSFAISSQTLLEVLTKPERDRFLP